MKSYYSDSKIQEIFDKQKSVASAAKKADLKNRRKKLNSIITYLENKDNEQELISAMYNDLHRPETEVLVSEIGIVIGMVKYICKNLKEWMQDETVSTPLPLLGARSYIIKEPKGNVLIISPWNYPFQLAIVPLCYAIAAGNTVIIKPSEYSAYTSAYIVQMVTQLFGIEEVAVVEGAITETQKLLSLPFNHIFFTGSPQVGKIVMRAAAEHLSSITLELGGKSPCIIDSSANLKSLVPKLVWGKFMNNGQTCIAPDYVLIPTRMEQELIKELKFTIETQLNHNKDGIANSNSYGRIINTKHFDRCLDLIADAKSKGANIIIGGDHDRENKFIAPTVITNAKLNMKIMTEEIFGPILPIYSYETKEKVIEMITSLPNPLALYIQSRNNKNTEYFISNTTAGGTVINDFNIHFANPHLPFGGVNNSGIGKTHGYYGFQEFTNERAVMKQRYGVTRLMHPPYGQGSEKLARWLNKWIN